MIYNYSTSATQPMKSPNHEPGYRIPDTGYRIPDTGYDKKPFQSQLSSELGAEAAQAESSHTAFVDAGTIWELTGDKCRHHTGGLVLSMTSHIIAIVFGWRLCPCWFHFINLTGTVFATRSMTCSSTCFLQ